MRLRHIQQSAVAQAAFAVIASLPVFPPPLRVLAFLETDRVSGKLLYFAALGACAVWYLIANGRENAEREQIEQNREDAADKRQAAAVQATKESTKTHFQQLAEQQRRDTAAQMDEMRKNHAAQIDWFKRISNQFVETERRKAEPVERAAMQTAVSLATSAVTNTATSMPLFTKIGLALPPSSSAQPVSQAEKDRLRRLYEKLAQLTKAPPKGPNDQAAASSSLTSLVTGKPEQPPPGLPTNALQLPLEEPPKGSDAK